MQLLLQEAINFAKTNSTHIELKEEQKEAVRNIVNGRDVIAVLPTGFGKSLIYQLFTINVRLHQFEKKKYFCCVARKPL